MRLNKEKGSILITLIVAMVMMAALGIGIYTLTTSSTFSELLSNSNDKAYQLARAGIRYGNSLIAANPTYTTAGTTDTYKMPDASHRFEIAIANVGVYKVITSTGVVNPDSFLEARRVLTALLASSGTVGLPPGIGDFDIPKPDLKKYFSPVDMAEVDIKSNPEVEGDRALNLKTDLYTMGLKWYANPSLPWFDQIRDANGGLLNYGVQVKILPETLNPPPGQQTKYFMAGISFRLDDTNGDNTMFDNMYGISFFQMNSTDSGKPSWFTLPGGIGASGSNWVKDVIDDITGMPIPITDGLWYVVLWKRDGGETGTHTLLAYKELDNADLVYNAGVLKAWSTIRVDVEEKIESGTRYNIIKGYLQAADSTGFPDDSLPPYPRRTRFNPDEPDRWDDESTGFFKKIKWTLPKVAGGASIDENGYIRDNSLTTLNYSSYTEATTTKAREVGLHQYYYTTAANKIYYDNFAIIASW